MFQNIQKVSMTQNGSILFLFSRFVERNRTVTEQRDYKWRCLSHIAQKACMVRHLLARRMVQMIQKNNQIRFFLGFVAHNYLSMDYTFSREDFLQRRLEFLQSKSPRHIVPT